ncbi:hypothetical protein [Parendozoicomonas haliclonae]|uniref:Uncharacterized protein n=1 Tax=Parendozoicomonas haliclonae TaxID=1960125 RepID=A0A1X7AJF6_9GAMM|nr:hypothetical protein [Parendozoicomonas haliclonae]SMA45464.1 hypothetical protein EHSB41UT_01925 [Parendozoicomonas haliclonae]
MRNTSSTCTPNRKSLTTLTLILALSLPVATIQASDIVIHDSGARIAGELIWSESPAAQAPVSTLALFSLKTENCGTLDFQASMAGLICVNCTQNTGVLKQCQIPRENKGWRYQR